MIKLSWLFCWMLIGLGVSDCKGQARTDKRPTKAASQPVGDGCDGCELMYVDNYSYWVEIKKWLTFLEKESLQ